MRSNPDRIHNLGGEAARREAASELVRGAAPGRKAGATSETEGGAETGFSGATRQQDVYNGGAAERTRGRERARRQMSESNLLQGMRGSDVGSRVPDLGAAAGDQVHKRSTRTRRHPEAALEKEMQDKSSTAAQSAESGEESLASTSDQRDAAALLEGKGTAPHETQSPRWAAACSPSPLATGSSGRVDSPSQIPPADVEKIRRAAGPGAYEAALGGGAAAAAVALRSENVRPASRRSAPTKAHTSIQRVDEVTAGNFSSAGTDLTAGNRRTGLQDVFSARTVGQEISTSAGSSAAVSDWGQRSRDAAGLEADRGRSEDPLRLEVTAARGQRPFDRMHEVARPSYVDERANRTSGLTSTRVKVEARARSEREAAPADHHEPDGYRLGRTRGRRGGAAFGRRGRESDITESESPGPSTSREVSTERPRRDQASWREKQLGEQLARVLREREAERVSVRQYQMEREMVQRRMDEIEKRHHEEMTSMAQYFQRVAAAPPTVARPAPTATVSSTVDCVSIPQAVPITGPGPPDRIVQSAAPTISGTDSGPMVAALPVVRSTAPDFVPILTPTTLERSVDFNALREELRLVTEIGAARAKLSGAQRQQEMSTTSSGPSMVVSVAHPITTGTASGSTETGCQAATPGIFPEGGVMPRQGSGSVGVSAGAAPGVMNGGSAAAGVVIGATPAISTVSTNTSNGFSLPISGTPLGQPGGAALQILPACTVTAAAPGAPVETEMGAVLKAMVGLMSAKSKPVIAYVPPTHIPHYGSKRGTEIRSWVNSMEAHFSAAQLDEPLWVVQVKAWVDPRLRREVEDLPTASWREFRAALIEQYDAADRGTMAVNQLFDTQQHQGESISDYMSRLKRTLFKAYPKMDKEGRNSILVDLFTRGLSDERVRLAVMMTPRLSDTDGVRCPLKPKAAEMAAMTSAIALGIDVMPASGEDQADTRQTENSQHGSYAYTARHVNVVQAAPSAVEELTRRVDEMEQNQIVATVQNQPQQQRRGGGGKRGGSQANQQPTAAAPQAGVRAGYGGQFSNRGGRHERSKGRGGYGPGTQVDANSQPNGTQRATGLRACYTCGGLDHLARTCPQSAHPSTTSTNSNQPRPPLKCYNCGVLGHIARNCKTGGGSNGTATSAPATAPSGAAPRTQPQGATNHGARGGSSGRVGVNGMIRTDYFDDWRVAVSRTVS